MFTLPGLPTAVNHKQVIVQMVRRASSLGFDSWWQRAQSVGFCASPIQLVGTDDFGRQTVVWVRCNNRRASVCPSCSDLYARDTWQLVAAGTTGDRHGIPAEVADRPQVFTTLTAPSFGAVHSSAGHACSNQRRKGGFPRCAHGKPLLCSMIHTDGDPVVGQPLCAQCYDYIGHVLFTWHLPELWRRFTITLRRAITNHLKTIGAEPKSVRPSFVKVVEMQARALPHVHALIRLDPPECVDSGTPTTGDQRHHGPAATGGEEPRRHTRPTWVSPITAAALAVLIQQAARTVAFNTPNPVADSAAETGEISMATVRFGNQIDTQPIAAETRSASTLSGAGKPASVLSPRWVAGYLAKYVTKSLADFGISARRLSAEAIADLQVSEHVRAVLITIDTLTDRAQRSGIDTLAAIGRWLHTLGYRGHITTKSRRYSITLGKLRAIRATWTRRQMAEKTVVQSCLDAAGEGRAHLVQWEFDRARHLSLGDRAFLVSAALRQAETRRVGLVERRRVQLEGVAP